MKRFGSILALPIAVALIASAPPDDDAPVKDGIRAILDRQVADWNRRDLDAFCDGYWKSPELVFQSAGDKRVGWEAMRARYRERYQGEGREMGRLAFRDLEIVPLGSGSGFARGRWELALEGGKTIGGLFTVILERKAEGWRIIHDHTSSDSP